MAKISEYVFGMARVVIGLVFTCHGALCAFFDSLRVNDAIRYQRIYTGGHL
jgi:hypothetical protein